MRLEITRTLAALVVLAVAMLLIGAQYGYERAMEAWQRHEIAHGRSWPPLPRPIPPPPHPPPPKHSGEFRGPY